MKFAQIALRNLARNRRRTALSLLLIVSGSVALLLTAGFIRYSFNGLREAIVRGGLGHLEVAPVQDLEASPLERSGSPGLSEWEGTRRRIEAVPHVLAAEGAIRLTGLISKGDRTVAAMGLGIEPEREYRMGFETKLRAGSYLSDNPPAEGEDAVVLGLGLARALGVSPGDIVTLTAVTTDGTLNAYDMTVTGLITTGLQDLDARFFKAHLASAQRLLGTGNVSSLLVALDDTGRTLEVAAVVRSQIDAERPGLAVADWESRATFYGQVKALYSGIFWFLGGIVFVLVCLATSNTLLMAVLERVREIGTLLALGTSRGQVAAIVVLEALWLGLFGATLGNLLGFGLASAINAAHFKMPPPPGAASGIDLMLELAFSDFALVAVVMLAVVSVAATLPVLRAVRLRIVEALGHV